MYTVILAKCDNQTYTIIKEEGKKKYSKISQRLCLLYVHHARHIRLVSVRLVLLNFKEWSVC